MQFARSEMCVAYVDGRIYVPGGFENGNPVYIQSDVLEAYDIASGKWLTLAPMPEARHHLMCAAHEGAIYVFGGGGPDTPANNVWRYDPATDSWTALAPMPEERNAGAAVALDGYLYVVGGQGGTEALLRYDPAADSWSTLAAMRQPREHNAAVVLDGEIFALAGRWQGATNAVESYDPATDSWSTRNSMRQDRSGFGATVLDGRIIVAGGEVIDGAPFALDSIEVYNPESRSWEIIPLTLPGPLHGLPIVAVDGALYVVGGSGVAGVVSNRGDLFVALLLE
jgi:N-acetylneuraminic acid mutarotase